MQEALTGQASHGLANDAETDIACLGKVAEVHTSSGREFTVEDSLPKDLIDILGQRRPQALSRGHGQLPDEMHTSMVGSFTGRCS